MSMTENAGRSVLFVRIPDIPREIEDKWNIWYDREHIAYRLVRPGFIGARRYYADEGPHRYFCMYEMESPAALTSPSYLAHRRWEEARPEGTFESIAPNLKGFARGVYEQRALNGATYRVPASDAVLIADVDSAGMSRNSLLVWFAEKHSALTSRVPHVRGVRLLMLTETPLSTTTGKRTARPEAIVQYDLDSVSRDDVPSIRAGLMAIPGADKVLPAAEEGWLFGRQIYTSFSGEK